MNKKIAVGLSLIIFAFLVSAIFIVLSPVKKEEIRSPVALDAKKINTEPETKITLSGKTKVYIDPSGFTFNYPEELKINSKPATGNSIYAQLELVFSSPSGLLSIDVTNSNLNSVDEWVKTNKKIIGNSEVKKIKLADLDARQFATDKQITTVAFDQGALFQIVSPVKTGNDFWSKVNQTIVSSFAFVETVQNSDSSSAANDNSSEDDVSFEGEEVVE